MTDLSQVDSAALIHELSERTRWILTPSPHRSDCYDRVFWVKPDSVGFWYRQYAVVATIGVGQNKEPYGDVMYYTHLKFSTMRASDVQLRGPFESEDKAIRRASRLMNLLTDVYYIPSRVELEKIARDSGTTVEIN